MSDIEPFALLLVLAAAAALAAVASHRLGDRFGVPAPAIFLIAAAGASDVFPRLGSLSIEVDQRIVTVALALILFEGGVSIGWHRFRTEAGAVIWLGVAGTAVTAAAMAAAAHVVLGYGWHLSLVVGTALAPTDPAVVFSVLGRREIEGRAGTILKGESGANDPVGIALMVSLLGFSGHGARHELLDGSLEFGLQMVLGLAAGVFGAWVLLALMRHVSLPNEALYSLQTIAFAILVYGLTAVCHGSGFLAVFLMGILVGDARAPFKREIERFTSALSSLSEIVVFVVLGLSISLSEVLDPRTLGLGLTLAGLLIFVIRPVLVGLVLWPVRPLGRGERGFVLWAGLKGAVPILLGTYVVVEGTPHASEIYHLIVVVVTASVVLQGSLVPVVARALGVPMQTIQPAPWALGMRFRDEPSGLHQYLVEAGSPADGATIAGLSVGDDVWISMISRGGQLVQARSDTVLREGDEVLALAEDDAASAAFRRS
jgi:cell volume regulation protein A